MADKILWSDMYNLALAIDNLAASKGIPIDTKADEQPVSGKYRPLTLLHNKEDHPYSVKTVKKISFAYHFETEARTTTITDHWMASQLYSEDLLNLDDPFFEMAKNEDLFFVYTDDGCWCSTIFRVKVQENGILRYQLEAVGKDDPSFGCCQTLQIPTASLNYDQNVIPAGYAAHYAKGINASVENGVTWAAEARCKEDSDFGASFRLVDALGDGKIYMTAAQRLMTGFLVWPIRQEWASLLTDRLTMIINLCAHKGGINHVIASPDGMSGVYEGVPIGCGFSLDDVVNTMTRGGSLTAGPGCLSEVDTGTENLYPNVKPVYDLCLPWFNKCCNSKECNADPNAGPNDKKRMLVYKKTFDDLTAILNKIGNSIGYTTNNHCCGLDCGSGGYTWAGNEPGENDFVKYDDNGNAVFHTEATVIGPGDACPQLGGSSSQIRVTGNWSGFGSIKIGNYTCNGCYAPFGVGFELGTFGPGEQIPVDITVFPGSPGQVSWSLTGLALGNSAP